MNEKRFHSPCDFGIVRVIGARTRPFRIARGTHPPIAHCEGQRVGTDGFSRCFNVSAGVPTFQWS